MDMLRSSQISLKTPDEQQKLRVAGALAADVLDMIGEHVLPGVSTEELDRICHDYIVNVQKTIPANVGYRGFPSDPSRMYFVGKPPAFAQRLAQVCKDAMWSAIDLVRPGAHLGDIGHAIQTLAEAEGFSVVREYCGHGIGRVYHEDPQILHYGEPGTGLEIRPGMVFTIEPMINAGKRHVRVLPDGWTVVTKDHSLSAQWEHMVLVTPNGHEVLTLSPRAGH